jgi:hypothetical protein
MSMKLVGIKMPEQLAAELQRITCVESLRRGRQMTMSGLLRELAQDFVRREQSRTLETTMAGR